MFTLYILQSARTRKFYIGSTGDLRKRLREHNWEQPGLGRSTVSGRPWKLVLDKKYESRAQAMAAERYVKRMKSKRWIARLIAGEYQLPPF